MRYPFHLSVPCHLSVPGHLWPAEQPHSIRSPKIWTVGRDDWFRLPHGLRPGLSLPAHAETLLEKAAQLHQARVELLDGQGEGSGGDGPLFEEPLRTPWKMQSQTIDISKDSASTFPLWVLCLVNRVLPPISGGSKTERQTAWLCQCLGKLP